MGTKEANKITFTRRFNRWFEKVRKLKVVGARVHGNWDIVDYMWDNQGAFRDVYRIAYQQGVRDAELLTRKARDNG